MTGAAGPGSEARSEPSGPTSFGKYQLFASLGRGGMADVFLSVARGQMGWSKLAVVKRLRPALADDPTFRNMFLDEARLAARLSHPNIVHTYEVGQQSGVYFIAMEYLEGQSLNKVLKEAARRKVVIEPTVCVRIVADALAGLGYAHELRDYDGSPLNVIHRDVSPHNIFVTYDGFTKLVDFGIAKAALSSNETEVGVLKGKVAYMAPEQAMGLTIDARSDVFAMGIVLWELIAQRRLMTGESAANTLHKLMNEPIPRLSEAVPGVEPELEAIVTRALEKDADARWRSAGEMREALEAWLAKRPPTRTEDVGRQMLALFGAFREETQRQIQRYMAATSSAATTQELQALSTTALTRLEEGGAQASGQFLQLAMTPRDTGSGSGSTGSVGALGSTSSPSVYSSPALGAQPPATTPVPPRSNTLVAVVLAGFFLLAAAIIVAVGLRRRPATVGAAPSASAVATAAPSASAPPSGAPSSSSVPETSSEAPTLSPSALPTATTPPRVSPPRRPPVTPPKPTTKPATPPAPAEEEPGFVTMSAYPWAKVTEGARTVCPVTPCSKVPMSPGPHTLTFENGESPGQKQTVTVSVTSGETAIKNVGFK